MRRLPSLRPPPLSREKSMGRSDQSRKKSEPQLSRRCCDITESQYLADSFHLRNCPKTFCLRERSRLLDEIAKGNKLSSRRAVLGEMEGGSMLRRYQELNTRERNRAATFQAAEKSSALRDQEFGTSLKKCKKVQTGGTGEFKSSQTTWNLCTIRENQMLIKLSCQLSNVMILRQK